MTDVFESAFTTPMTRRLLIKRVAAAGAATMAAGGVVPALARAAGGGNFHDFSAIAPSAADVLEVPDGYEIDVVIKWGDEFGDGLRFGYNCDYSAWFPFKGKGDEGLIYVSHEYLVPFFTTEWVNTTANNALWDPRVEPYKTLMQQEKRELGGSIVHIKLGPDGWGVVDSGHNRRIYADGPPIPFTGPAVGSGLLPDGDFSLGTLGNCSGCHTPWETVLTCEENPQSFGLERGVPLVFSNGWIRDDQSEEGINYYVGEEVAPNAIRTGPAIEKPYYGYVTEIDPFTGDAVKHTALGRIHHENVSIAIGPDGHVIAYTGDDAPAADGMFFKYVSNKPYRPGMPKSEAMQLLADGQLYVAQWLPKANDPAVNSGTGVWHALDMSPESCAFTTKWVVDNIVPANGGDIEQFKVPRAEDCEVLPSDRRGVLIALTSAQGRPADPAAYGVVRLLEEDSIRADSQTFRWVELLEGGQHTGLASPDNMAFSSPQDLWVVTDISTSSLNRPGRNFEWHMNNAIYYVPLQGKNKNVAFRFANAPVEAELTGPTFNHKQRTLFVNVQHPGENSVGDPTNPMDYRSWWPDGNRTAQTGTPGKPKPSLVAIRKT